MEMESHTRSVWDHILPTGAKVKLVPKGERRARSQAKRELDQRVPEYHPVSTYSLEPTPGDDLLGHVTM